MQLCYLDHWLPFRPHDWAPELIDLDEERRYSMFYDSRGSPKHSRAANGKATLSASIGTMTSKKSPPKIQRLVSHIHRHLRSLKRRKLNSQKVELECILPLVAVVFPFALLAVPPSTYFHGRLFLLFMIPSSFPPAPPALLSPILPVA
ncbi:hypothetical protein BDQ12DRAFT_726710 [Crucibulum laeve]|uniref:Uncharacterized protein n=1 Tax=Crucibulum laeve TaxID=68775 RepID=A0A5C3LNB3_9AGAR|nr:hypothetical protein BDQ12DRAFT_726710 [Crucibulum laeve]